MSEFLPWVFVMLLSILILALERNSAARGRLADEIASMADEVALTREAASDRHNEFVSQLAQTNHDLLSALIERTAA